MNGHLARSTKNKFVVERAEEPVLENGTTSQLK